MLCSYLMSMVSLLLNYMKLRLSMKLVQSSSIICGFFQLTSALYLVKGGSLSHLLLIRLGTKSASYHISTTLHGQSQARSITLLSSHIYSTSQVKQSQQIWVESYPGEYLNSMDLTLRNV